jgi:hypothetical protein
VVVAILDSNLYRRNHDQKEQKLAKIFGNSIWLLRPVMLSEWLEFKQIFMSKQIADISRDMVREISQY